VLLSGKTPGDFTKRIAAVAGDSAQCMTDGSFYVNDQLVPPAVAAPRYWLYAVCCIEVYMVKHITHRCCREVRGSNRVSCPLCVHAAACVCRQQPPRQQQHSIAVWGPVQVPERHVAVLGDASAVSFDSRSWGFLDTRRIVGRAVVRYWPPSRVGWL
jgi:Signal peptidase, peptidase S26